ncbi:hypothetical protein EJ04DRAFT_511206 [Polyplosphaeria fusca]|uniref:Uncharacterized protein n=1 Tax=Polyplosphaeria fusca TaxID=682080 RepID=A0A9P4QYG6_9PLEO|nr:hypothetical protein EJ04DRAFT_511206 [Polyplosphaeria fusca]
MCPQCPQANHITHEKLFWYEYSEFWKDEQYRFLSAAFSPADENTPLSDLDNRVHDLFSISNWGNESVSFSLWDAIEPSLRVASLLIKEKKMMGYWSHVANGFVVGDAEGKLHIASSTLEDTSEGQMWVEAIFDHLATKTNFSFESLWEEAIYARHSTYRPHAWVYPETLRIKVAGKVKERPIYSTDHFIQIDRHWLEYFENIYAEDDFHRKMLMQWSFISSLMHEVAHAFMCVCHGHIMDHCQYEPRVFFENGIFEAGYQYEMFLYGSKRLAAFDESMKYGHGIETQWNTQYIATDTAVSQDGFPDLFLPGEPGTTEFIIPTSWMNSWFFKATWDQIRKSPSGFSFMQNEISRVELRKFLLESINSVIEVTVDGVVKAKMRGKENYDLVIEEIRPAPGELWIKRKPTPYRLPLRPIEW